MLNDYQSKFQEQVSPSVITGKVVQYADSIVRRDAIGNHIVNLHKKLQEVRIHSAICARETDYPEFVSQDALKITRSLDHNDVLLAHVSFLDPIIEQITETNAKKVMVYHNITPSVYFSEHGMTDLAVACAKARALLPELIGKFTKYVTVSQYNARELLESGAHDVTVLSIPHDLSKFLTNHEDSTAAKTSAGDGSIILSVGRFVPNKRYEDVIDTFDAFRKQYDPNAQLYLVGKVWNQSYQESLYQRAHRNNIDNAVHFIHNAPLKQLVSLYRSADAFLGMSEHEGFMVPILEALAAGAMVFAFDAGAVSETLGAAGILLKTKSPEVIAFTMYSCLSSRGIRKVTENEAAKVLKERDYDTVATQWINYIQAHTG